MLMVTRLHIFFALLLINAPANFLLVQPSKATFCNYNHLQIIAASAITLWPAMLVGRWGGINKKKTTAVTKIGCKTRLRVIIVQTPIRTLLANSIYADGRGKTALFRLSSRHTNHTYNRTTYEKLHPTLARHYLLHTKDIQNIYYAPANFT